VTADTEVMPALIFRLI